MWTQSGGWKMSDKSELEKDLNEAAKKEEAAIEKEEAARSAQVASVKAASMTVAIPEKTEEQLAAEKRVEERAKVKKEKSEALLKDIKLALEEYGLEGNIPINHQYWNWQNELRSLR
jgi:hypothetical protein